MAKLTPTTRDELLIRLDERVVNLVEDTKEIKTDIKAQNGRQRKTDRKLNTLIGILVGCGVIGGSATGIVQLIG